MLVIFGILYGRRFSVRRRRIRTPLTRNLLRSPGESLRNRIDDLSEDIIAYLLFILLAPFLVYSIHISQSYFGCIPESAFRVAVSALTALGILLFFSYKLVHTLNLRRRLRLAHDAEMSVGQKLNQLMHKGYHVYHDFPAERFNIDHVLAGPAGVFAVETKARTKKSAADAKTNAEVIYDGNSLQFPGWTEKEPIQQTIDQAGWLRKWLSSAIGEPVEVIPVLTLPDWFVKRVSPSGIAVLNPKQFHPYLDAKKRTGFSETLIKRIVHQLDQRCRDVEPKAYELQAKRF
jgi:hypothetical protein